ncbi:hypothetical protein BVRB_6g148210 [Beta vulgaris subsp. vulgaris]|nr:hypothetical protein BVRB_6g148210 [Beta vulgaris subsp. vulgaris]
MPGSQDSNNGATVQPDPVNQRSLRISKTIKTMFAERLQELYVAFYTTSS